MLQKLSKSTTDRALFGVCGGIAESLGISPLIVRTIFFVTVGFSIYLYIFLAAVLRDK
ncbi:PspC domain-containing protein [Bacillus sp. HNG]|uniref:PspC domain-containing protein n=1 Tax=Bacillus sp. HNG TaxID=2293325 RepID=UPI000E2FE66F|nr:PspC domain-containing protein [Bacillus sp. HNG]RFB11414.1 PspC domain-containing protein [Bacillus sp. HNG]